MSAVLHFGKNQGKTLVDTVFSDPAWYSWAVHRGVFHDRGGPALQIEAERIWLKARHIRKPREYPDGWQVAYYYQGWNHKFLGLRVVADGRYEEHADVKTVSGLRSRVRVRLQRWGRQQAVEPRHQAGSVRRKHKGNLKETGSLFCRARQL